MEKYEQLMENQRLRSRGFESLRQKFGEESFVFAPVLIREPENIQSRFVGYEESNFEITTEVIEAGPGWVILRDNPFYAQSGGQVSDLGRIRSKTNEDILVREVHKVFGVNIPRFDGVHDLRQGDPVDAQIDKPRRLSTMRNHTATHLVHEALRRVLGAHLQQQGSLVAPDRLRFDFNHFAKISPDQLKAVEDIVNQKIADSIVVQALNDPKQWITIEEAKRRYPNVKMFFGDKYGDHVRIVEIDPKFSVELCGGTHVKNTHEIGFFKIIFEGSSASGVRRIEAITSDHAVEYLKIQNTTYRQRIEFAYQLIDEIQAVQKEIIRLSNDSSLPVQENTLNLDIDLRKLEQIPETPAVIVTERLSQAFSEIHRNFRRLEDYILMLSDKKKSFEKELAKFNLKSAASDIDALVQKATAVNGFKLVASKIDVADMEALKSIADTLRAKIGSGVGVLASIIDDKVALVCVVSDDLIKSKNIQAGKIVGAIAKIVGGGGGGKAHLATAGGKDVGKLDEALTSVAAIIQGMI
jgi:alanyl-tRNA synthetase